MPVQSKDALWVFVARKPHANSVKFKKVALTELSAPKQNRRSVLDPTLGRRLEHAFAVAVTEARRVPAPETKRRSAPSKRTSTRR